MTIVCLDKKFVQAIENQLLKAYYIYKEGIIGINNIINDNKFELNDDQDLKDHIGDINKFFKNIENKMKNHGLI